MTIDDRTIDRLVDGELADDERRALLASLEQAPGEWRRVALAFLEEQSWRAEARNLAEFDGFGAAEGRPGRSRRWWPRLAIAAGWLLAFAGGWALHARAPGRPEILVAQADPPRVAQVVPADPNPPPGPEKRPEPPEEPSLPPVDEALVKAWERRGFQVEKRERLVTVGPPNGPKRSVPVPEFRLKYIGNRTF
ncbi:MAG: hypothetical protein U0800_05435 [Isosphaeraceae bacterium]